jgi:hypothetical protein
MNYVSDEQLHQLAFDFPHAAPEGYSYEVEPFKRGEETTLSKECPGNDWKLGRPSISTWRVLKK